MNNNPFATGNNYTVFNPTPFPILAKYNNVEIPIEPFGKFETPYKDVHRHLTTNRNLRARGLVDLTYDESAKIRFKTIKDFEKAKAIEGLKQLETLFAKSLGEEKRAMQDSASNGGGALDTMTFKVKEYEERLKKIQEFITKYLQDTQTKKVSDELGPDKK